MKPKKMIKKKLKIKTSKIKVKKAGKNILKKLEKKKMK